MPTTTRAALRYPVLADTPDVPRDIGNLAADADAAFALAGQGTFASRPTSSAGTPGKTSRLYYGTDTGHLYWDFGTGWTDIGPSSTAIPDASITGGPAGAGVKLAADTITHDNIAVGGVRGGGNEIAAATITAADIASSLKPSGGAGGSTEALRALGTAAGTAATGTHASQHSRTGADPLVISTFFSTGILSARPSTSLVAGQGYVATDAQGGTFYLYSGAAWVQAAAGVTAGGGGAPAAHASTHLAGGSDAIGWTTVHGAGTFASRPTVGSTNAGYLYFATDTSNLYRSDGSAWTLIAGTVSTLGSVITFGAGSMTAFQTGLAQSTYTDVTGATVTVPSTGTYLVEAGAASIGTGQQGQGVSLQVLDNAVQIGPIANNGGFGGESTFYAFTASLTAGHTVKLQANPGSPTTGQVLGGFVKITRLS